MNRFPKQARVIRSDDFSDIIRNGAHAADAVLVVNVRAAAEQPPQPSAPEVAGAGNREAKLGISIPRKTGSAVVRNRWKRWIREAFRTQRQQLPAGLEIIVRPRRDARGSYAAVAKSLGATVRRAAKKLSR